MDNPYSAALQYTITPLNYSNTLVIQTTLDGSIINQGVDRYKDLTSKHLKISKVSDKRELQEKNISYILVQTNQSKIQIAQASKVYYYKNGKKLTLNPSYNAERDGKVHASVNIDLSVNESFTTEKLVSLCSSNHSDVKNVLTTALENLNSLMDFSSIFSTSLEQWKKLWNQMDIQVYGDRLVQKLIRMHIYHLLVTTSPNTQKIDFGIPARGLHGEAYRGHIFWDELYILPLYYLNLPEVAKSVLMYRYNRLPAAKTYAKEFGFEGAMYPWQSGSSGKEETQQLHLNPISGAWGPDYSSYQRHVSLAIAYNVWQYYWFTTDTEFLKNYGIEVLVEISRFWVSKTQIDEQGRYNLNGVMGPDEFHEHYPNTEKPGLKNNFYTNIMVVWLLNRIFDVFNELKDDKKDLFRKLHLYDGEIEKWRAISNNMKIEISDDGIFEQFAGYFKLKELDWEGYRKKYDNISRMDRILKAEGKSPDQYKVAKQADTLMTFFTIHPNQVRHILTELGYEIDDQFLEINIDYYLQRTSHGSTLSRVVHSYLLSLVERTKESKKFFMEALKSDYIDIQGGTTGEGIHTGVMASTVLMVITGYCGLDLSSEPIKIAPDLPENWEKVLFSFEFRNCHYKFEISQEKLRIQLKNVISASKGIVIDGKLYEISNSENQEHWFEYDIA
jgi:trehalose/maltose hydrolase-like predicted phosphorylase